ncbi:nucleoside deaminase [Bordetella bronchiseptica]|uniref:nucleoside deaminase n=1 Tax=Bordetella bronchiseptica TaxID=518 RepID=UPI00081C40B4|nr:nucleoside deaminase [Bordetella bronchiseptica]AOB25749.1 tRNA-specific adenosine deaminase [Bordetella bronchiseptica]AZW43011.1 nucleoside deaminase [Bordetella bronchiseptica]
MRADSNPGVAAPDDDTLLREAIALARANARAGGRPFGALVARDGVVLARGVNRMLADHDPTAHAELLALREAGRALRSARLDGCVVYASGQPCPMCLAAMRMSGVARAVYAYSNEQAEPYGLSTAALAAELELPPQRQPGFAFEHRPGATGPDADLYREWRDGPHAP